MKTIKNLIEETFKKPLIWPGATKPTVSTQSPDKIGNGMVGLYLYHIIEDPYFKNTSVDVKTKPIQFTPMGLNLFFQVTAKGADRKSVV